MSTPSSSDIEDVRMQLSYLLGDEDINDDNDMSSIASHIQAQHANASKNNYACIRSKRRRVTKELGAAFGYPTSPIIHKPRLFKHHTDRPRRKFPYRDFVLFPHQDNDDLKDDEDIVLHELWATKNKHPISVPQGSESYSSEFDQIDSLVSPTKSLNEKTLISELHRYHLITHDLTENQFTRQKHGKSKSLPSRKISRKRDESQSSPSTLHVEHDCSNRKSLLEYVARFPIEDFCDTSQRNHSETDGFPFRFYKP